MAIEEERFRYICKNQQKLRSDLYGGLMDAIVRGDSDCSMVGKTIILPSSHTGGPRYRAQNYQDSMAICIYTIEFQKRGLPHDHILFFLHETQKNPTTDHINRVISAEIPDYRAYPDGYNAVKNFMMHRPSGEQNPSCPCMKQGKCTKYFPKKYNDRTNFDSDGFLIYMRRKTGIEVKKNRASLDNRNVVPYNRDLLVQFDAYINVEVCNYARSVKYLFKKPAVERLPFHLQGKNTIIFDESMPIESVISRHDLEKIEFTEWFKANKEYPDARELTYSDFPTCWVRNGSDKKWTRRKKGHAVGRIYFAHPGSGERFYMRMLLNFVKGYTSFESIRRINGVDHKTYREGCYALGLLDDDKEWNDCLSEAAHWASGNELRHFFVTVLMNCQVSATRKLWENNYGILSKDITHIQ
ncbi:uncharacterized protein LOC125856887 [Solanum stenotomum]|uniref:uncharacterized protein LOC125856887 n=1 Tax=Solanum stenotomum TaxID=172797 RepID=UPI0020D113EE|nr:uncharacterized protein LOC125856887 [Solanum stenotomum]